MVIFKVESLYEIVWSCEGFLDFQGIKLWYCCQEIVHKNLMFLVTVTRVAGRYLFKQHHFECNQRVRVLNQNNWFVLVS